MNGLAIFIYCENVKFKIISNILRKLIFLSLNKSVIFINYLRELKIWRQIEFKNRISLKN